MKKKIISILKKIYQKTPLSRKTKEKIKCFLIHRTNLFRKIDHFNNEMLKEELSIECIPFSKKYLIKSLDKKICVHLHLYYIDLTEEFVSYLNKIPYHFDLFISVNIGENKKEIKEKFMVIKNVNEVVVEECQNQGRDFSPMLCQFGKRIMNYDYLLHLHSKKSIRTGSEQDGWRKHLVDNLLLNEEIIENIFYQFEHNETIGLIYPETYWDMPYWAHTYLKNMEKCSWLANKMGIQIKDEYIDYSVGSMFWAKTSALKILFQLNLKYSDFGKEEGKADGTLAHALERIIPLVVKKSNMNFLVIDTNERVFRNSGKKNLNQYFKQTKETTLMELMKYQTISFDIFDTLITRKIYNPSEIYDLIAIKIKKDYNFTENFKNLRIQAETNVRIRKNYIGDCTLDEIYLEFSKLTNVSKKIADSIKNTENLFELEFAIPRNDMLDIFNELKKNKKNIVLISDMYLDSFQVTKMLMKCGYNGWNEMLISSETGLRKDSGEIWNDYYRNHENTIHVGDNEASDIQMNCDLGKPFVHVMQGKKMFCLGNESKYIFNHCKLTPEDSICLGLTVNKKIYNSPFIKSANLGIDDFKTFGYCFLGPIFYNFFCWLDKEIKNNKNDKLLFLAREGYYFQKMYQAFCEFHHEKPIENMYFLASRRAVSIANLQKESDIDELLSDGYEGSLSNFLKNRFGLTNIIEDDSFIKLEESKKEVKKIIMDHKAILYKNSALERESYHKYLMKNIKNSENPAVIDLGYSGTIQYYLNKINKHKIDGYYVTLTENAKPLKLGCICKGCFDSSLNNNEKNIYRFSMILESFLTAPFGQLIKLEKKKNDFIPIYKKEEIDDEFFSHLDEIYQGVIEMIKDLSELIPDNIELSNLFVSSNFSSLVYADHCLSKKLKDFFILENDYSLDGNLNVFDYLNLVYNKKDE